MHGIDVPWQSRAHFYAVCARLMRRILVDRARTRGSRKRGAEVRYVPFEDWRKGVPARDVDLLALDEALSRLAASEPRKSKVVQLRYFGGLTVEETAAALGISPETAARDWRQAKSRLLQALKDRASKAEA